MSIVLLVLLTNLGGGKLHAEFVSWHPSLELCATAQRAAEHEHKREGFDPLKPNPRFECLASKGTV